MGQLPNNDIPQNRAAAGYRYDPKIEVEKADVVATGNVIEFQGEQFERPVSSYRSN